MFSKHPQTISDYIKTAPKESQGKLREMRAIVEAVVPDAVESIKWAMPAYSYGRILVMFAGFKHHIGLYPTPAALTSMNKEIAGYKTGKGSIQFPLDKPLPKALITKIVKLRVKESVERDGKWRS